MFNKEKTVCFSLRISKERYEIIRTLVNRNMRSLNKQIEFMLDQYLQDNPIESSGSDPE